MLANKRRWLLRKFERCAPGSEIVDYLSHSWRALELSSTDEERVVGRLINNLHADLVKSHHHHLEEENGDNEADSDRLVPGSRGACVWIGQELVHAGVLRHVTNAHDFGDNGYFFRFGDLNSEERDREDGDAGEASDLKPCKCLLACACKELGRFKKCDRAGSPAPPAAWAGYAKWLDDHGGLCAVWKADRPRDADTDTVDVARAAVQSGDFSWRDVGGFERTGFKDSKLMSLTGLLDVSGRNIREIGGLGDAFSRVRVLIAAENRLSFDGDLECPLPLAHLRVLDLSFNELTTASLDQLMQNLDSPLEVFDASSNRTMEAFYLHPDTWPCFKRGTLRKFRFMDNKALKVPLLSEQCEGFGVDRCLSRCAWRLLRDDLELDLGGTPSFCGVQPMELGHQDAYVILPDNLAVRDGSVRTTAIREYVMNAERGVAYNVFLRLMVVGFAGVGKTTLVEALLDSRSWIDSAVRSLRDLLGRRRITYGVDIEHDWRPRDWASLDICKDSTPKISDDDNMMLTGGPPPGEERIQVRYLKSPLLFFFFFFFF
jgi:hypothetical protein